MNDLLKDLFETIDIMEAEEVQIKIEDESFKIENRDQANYFLRKINEIVMQQNEIETIAQAQIKAHTERIKAWKEKQLTPLKNSEAFMSGLLKDFAIRELKDSKAKTIKLPHGQIGFSKQQPEYSYDEEKVLEYLKSQGVLKDFIRVKTTEEINKADLKKAGSVVGNTLVIGDKMIEGVTVTAREDKFVIK